MQITSIQSLFQAIAPAQTGASPTPGFPQVAAVPGLGAAQPPPDIGPPGALVEPLVEGAVPQWPIAAGEWPDLQTALEQDPELAQQMLAAGIFQGQVPIVSSQTRMESPEFGELIEEIQPRSAPEFEVILPEQAIPLESGDFPVQPPEQHSGRPSWDTDPNLVSDELAGNVFSSDPRKAPKPAEDRTDTPIFEGPSKAEPSVFDAPSRAQRTGEPPVTASRGFDQANDLPLNPPPPPPTPSYEPVERIDETVSEGLGLKQVVVDRTGMDRAEEVPEVPLDWRPQTRETIAEQSGVSKAPLAPPEPVAATRTQEHGTVATPAADEIPEELPLQAPSRFEPVRIRPNLAVEQPNFVELVTKANGDPETAPQASSEEPVVPETEPWATTQPLRTETTLRPEAPQPTAKLDAAKTEEVMRQAIDRIESLAARRPGGRVTVRLEPAELGQMTVVVRSFGDRVDAQIVTNNSDVREALAANRSHLANQIEAKGLSLGSLSIGEQMTASTNPNGQGHAFHGDARHEFERLANAYRASTSALDPAPFGTQARATFRSSGGLDYTI